MAENKSIRWLDALTLYDIPLTDGKNASLGESAGYLPADINIPESFAISAVKKKLWESATNEGGGSNNKGQLLKILNREQLSDIANGSYP